MGEGSIHMPNIKFGEIRYNSGLAAFEARVDVIRDGVAFRYPCLARGPQDMPADVVQASLADHALRMSDSRA